jgi:hypothetical protein
MTTLSQIDSELVHRDRGAHPREQRKALGDTIVQR